MKHTSRIICGVLILALGICWALELAGLYTINFTGWWTLFIIIPSVFSLFNHKHRGGPLFGIGVGILLLLAARGIILWPDLWKYILCLIAVVWGLSLIFFRNCCFDCKQSECHIVDEIETANQDGRQIHKINVSFCKQLYEFNGQRFEGADIQTSFGFTALDLRGADLLDGAVVNIECSFGGMEIRTDRNVCVITNVKSAFAGVENHCSTQTTDGLKKLYIKGNCSFAGIEIK